MLQFENCLEAKSRLKFDDTTGKGTGGSAETQIRIVTIIDSRAVGSETERSQIKLIESIE